jgi:hypothetical protein
MKNEIAYRHINEIEEIVAGDQYFFREIFHPDRIHLSIDFSLS